MRKHTSRGFEVVKGESEMVTSTAAFLLPPSTTTIRPRRAPTPRCAFVLPLEDPTREPTRASFNRLVRSHCSAGDPDISLSLLSRMDALGVPADGATYSSLVSSLASHGRTLEADAILLEMHHRGFPPPPSRSLLPLLSSFLRDGLLPRLLSLSSSYIRPALLLALLNHFSRSRRPDATNLLLSLIRRCGFLPLPSSSYAQLLSMYRDVGMWGRALRLVQEMRISGIPFDARVYHAVIDTLGRCGRTEAMVKAFEKMRGEGVRPGVPTWNAMIRWACHGSPDTGLARGILERMMEEGVRPDPRVFLPVISRLGEEGRWGELREVFEGMRRRGFSGSGAVYAVLADIYGQYGAFRDARSSVSALRAEGVDVSPRVFCVLANAYAQQGLCEQTVQVFRLMEDEGIEPNLKMLNLLMNAFGIAGRYLEAKSIFEHVKESGLTPDVITYTTMMKAFMRAKKFEQVVQLFQEMEDSGCIPDRKALELLETASDALRQRGFVL